VIEVDRTNRQVRRMQGKSDPVDAIEAARAALSGRARGIAKTADGNVEAIRALLIAQRSGRQARARCLNQIRHLGFTSPDSLREQFRDVHKAHLAERAAALRPRADGDPVLHATKLAMRTLGRRALRSATTCTTLTSSSPSSSRPPALLACHGVGVDTAAILLVAAGDNPERIRNEAAGAPVRRRLDASIRQTAPASAQLRREPPSEPCAVADRVHPHGPRPRTARYVDGAPKKVSPNPRSCG
jgi:hypothetical protein